MIFVVEAWLVVAVSAWAWRSAQEERSNDLGVPRGSRYRAQPMFRSPLMVGATGGPLAVLAASLLLGSAHLVGKGSETYSELDQLAILGVPAAVFAVVLVSGSLWAVLVAMASLLYRHRPSRVMSGLVDTAALVGRVVVASAVAVAIGLGGVLLQVNVDSRVRLAAAEVESSFGLPWVDGDDNYRNHPVRALPEWTKDEKSSTPFASTASLIPSSAGAGRWLLGFQLVVLLGIAAGVVRFRCAHPLNLGLYLMGATVFGATIGAVCAVAVVKAGIASYNASARSGQPEVPFDANWWWAGGMVAASATAVTFVVVVASMLRALRMIRRPTVDDGTVPDASEPQLVMPPRPTRPRANSISPM